MQTLPFEDAVLKVALIAADRATWRGRGKRVTASTIIEVLEHHYVVTPRGPRAVDLDLARDLMSAAARAGLVELHLLKGLYWTNATVTPV